MQDEIGEAWDQLVNLTADELTEWLATETSWSVGDKRLGAESVGHAAGRRTVELLDLPRAQWSPDDWRHARKAIGVIRRHRAQWPERDVTDTRWRWALMNWGHDPLRLPPEDPHQAP